MLSLAVLQALIGVAWWRWLRREPRLAVGERLLCAGVLSIAQVVGVSLLLGWVGALTPAALIGGVLAASAAVALWPAGAVAQDPVAPRSAGGQGGAALLAALLAVTLAIVLTRGVLLPDAGWDGFKYHLPMTALMRQTQAFAPWTMPNPAIAAYPKTAEIWAHWLLAVCGDDRWLLLQQVPFLLLAMLAIWCAARRLGASAGAAAIAALLFPFAPVVLAQITTAYNDVVLAALVLAAAALLLALPAALATPLALALGAALGLLIGTKFVGVALAGLLAAALAAVALHQRGWRALPWLALIGGLALVLGGDAYWRNWRQHGNPVFPFRTAVLGLELPGPRTTDEILGGPETREQGRLRPLLRSWLTVDEISHSTIYGGLGVAWPLIALAGVVSIGLAARERDRRRLALYALGLALFLVVPLNFRARYALFLPGVACLAVAHVLDRAARRWRIALIVAILGVALTDALQVGLPAARALAGASARSTDLCSAAPPLVYRAAYAWLRRHAGGRTVLTFPGPELFPYCLWTPAVDNRVVFADARSADDLTALAAAHPAAILYLARDAPALAHWRGTDPSAWRTLFQDEWVTLVSRDDRASARPVE